MKLVTNDLQVRSEATIQRLGTTNELTHFFRLANGDIGNTRVFRARALEPRIPPSTTSPLERAII